MNPTPTPLASTAMEAARDLFPNWADNELATVSALIAHHFQPLLAKVEAERNEAVLQRDLAISTSKHCELGYKLAKTQQDQAEGATNALRADLAAKEAENKALLVLVHGDWRDKPDQWTKQIEAAHPMETNQFKQYEKALEMVGNRNGKYELVDLVNWLLSLSSHADKGWAT